MMCKSDKNRVCTLCWNEWISKKAVANAGVVVVNSKSEVLLLYNTDEGEWEIPSGSIDKADESIKSAALRELWEEARIRLSDEKLTHLDTVLAKHPYPKYPKDKDKNDVVVTFLTRSDERGSKSKEHTKLNWFPLQQQNNLPEMHDKTKELLKLAWEKVKKW